MITVHWHRDQGGYDGKSLVVRERVAQDALISLAKSELGFGGHITDVSERSVTVVTRILSCIDTTVFSGTPEEMRVLVEFVGCFLAVNKAFGSKIVSSVSKTLMQLQPDIGGVKAFDAATFGPMLMGERAVRVAIILMSNTETVEVFEAVMDQKIDLADLIAALLLAREGSTSFHEALLAAV